MARRKSNNRLDNALELWAAWNMPDSAHATGRTMLAKLIDNKGEIFFGGSGPSGGPADGLESRIEAAVLTMFAENALRADVLRLEYGAAYWRVAARRKLAGYDWRGGQFEKSQALGISLRTYRSRLAEARNTISTLLGIELTHTHYSRALRNPDWSNRAPPWALTCA